ncbi:hypothetical protein M885DRAFT_538423, partial [Pelagophyceae sp. CCMP2097]
MGDRAEVDVMACTRSTGAYGKASNRSKPLAAARRFFRHFVRMHRSSTGRSCDRGGRPHGAVFYLDAELLQVRARPGERPPVHSDQYIFSCVFQKALAAEKTQLSASGDAGLLALGEAIVMPSHKTVENWLRADFGIHTVPFDEEPAGHTTQHPHKTDSCSYCGSIGDDLKSIAMSKKRELQHANQAAVALLDEEAADLDCALKKHLDVARSAQENYRDAG